MSGKKNKEAHILCELVNPKWHFLRDKVVRDREIKKERRGNGKEYNYKKRHLKTIYTT